MIRFFITAAAMLSIVSLGVLSIVNHADAQTPYGSCPERAQYYQERYESDGQMSDMVCMQKAMERDLQDPSGYSCPDSAQSYQTSYETSGRFDDMICMKTALERELR